MIKKYGFPHSYIDMKVNFALKINLCFTKNPNYLSNIRQQNAHFHQPSKAKNRNCVCPVHLNLDLPSHLEICICRMHALTQRTCDPLSQNEHKVATAAIQNYYRLKFLITQALK